MSSRQATQQTALRDASDVRAAACGSQGHAAAARGMLQHAAARGMQAPERVGERGTAARGELLLLYRARYRCTTARVQADPIHQRGTAFMLHECLRYPSRAFMLHECLRYPSRAVMQQRFRVLVSHGPRQTWGSVTDLGVGEGKVLGLPDVHPLEDHVGPQLAALVHLTHTR